LVGAIRPPTVPDGTARLRLTVSAAHTDEQIDGLIDALGDTLGRARSARAAAPARPPNGADRLREIDRMRVWHPYTQHAIAAPAIPIARASGAWLHPADGEPILDMISSWWVTLHGHAHPAIADAVARQARDLEQVIFAGFTHEPAARLAEELTAVPRWRSSTGAIAVRTGVSSPRSTTPTTAIRSAR
jgi:glutamate-1-semialdehyde aminotransferase